MNGSIQRRVQNLLKNRPVLYARMKTRRKEKQDRKSVFVIQVPALGTDALFRRDGI
jgi:hypothetical protein